MKAGKLTALQQILVRKRFFKLLAAIGFKQENDFWWIQVGNKQDKRVCVAFDVPNACSGGRTGWIWQSATMNERPAFGYSGSCSVGNEWATLERLLEITLGNIYNEGFYRGLAVERQKLAKMKEVITGALEAISHIS